MEGPRRFEFCQLQSFVKFYVGTHPEAIALHFYFLHLVLKSFFLLSLLLVEWYRLIAPLAKISDI